jgi:hypothetical protein
VRIGIGNIGDAKGCFERLALGDLMSNQWEVFFFLVGVSERSNNSTSSKTGLAQKQRRFL